MTNPLLEDAHFALVAGDLPEALAAASAAIDAANDAASLAEARGLRGALQTRAGNLQAAREDLEAALSDAPRDAIAWGNLAIVLDRLGEGHGARLAHDEGLALLQAELGATHPRVLRKRCDRAFSALRAGDRDAAEADLRAAVAGFESHDRDPLWHAETLDKLGLFLLRERGDASSALECFDQRDALEPRASLVVRGRTLHEGFPEKTKAHFVKSRRSAERALG